MWKRALKLASPQTTGLTADDQENAPYLHFSQQSATEPAAASFVDAINYIVDWTTAWAARMRMHTRTISAERQLTAIRNAITNMLVELDHDMLITFTALGGAKACSFSFAAWRRARTPRVPRLRLHWLSWTRAWPWPQPRSWRPTQW